MTITIEEGKFYRTRDGRKVGPAETFSNKRGYLKRDINGLKAKFMIENQGSYTADGTWLTSRGADDEDLVAEWVDDTHAAASVEGAPIVEDDYFDTHKADGSAAEPLPEQFTHGDAVPQYPYVSADGQDLSGDVKVTPDVKAEIADEAKRIVSGARRAAYGKPEQNFERISAMWTAYAKAKGWPIEFEASDVSPMMILMKLARVVETKDHRDSMVDIVGYCLTMAEVNGVKST